MEERDIAIKIENVKKRYRLGLIGGGTLKADLQSWWARVRHKEDPNLKIGQKKHSKNEVFMALDGIDLTVYKGERLGIIGHNGAGKSTLLKLLARVTGPTEGAIYIDGRISSMLEVGTGFNGELTGRENIYLNGAILGMSKEEIDGKVDSIIEFSECAQFIDTPVKRYSSGMFVKLAFAVAAHLDAEILIMDEVLAVGDMKFQQKCLGKMSDVSNEQGKTVLYVSHNMNTIRQLCDRCVVLDHGKVIYDGDVEEAISIYMKHDPAKISTEGDLLNARRFSSVAFNRKISFASYKILNKCADNTIDSSEKVKFELSLDATQIVNNAGIRLMVKNGLKNRVGSILAKNLPVIEKGINKFTFDIDLSRIPNGVYSLSLVCFEQNEFGTVGDLDIILDAFAIRIKNSDMDMWPEMWGVRIDEAKLI